MREYNYPAKKLGKLYLETNDLLHWVWQNVSNIISEQHIRELEDRTLEEIYINTKNKASGIGWSGGKDSLATTRLCSKVGIIEGVQALAHSELEYPALDKWYSENRPKSIKVYRALGGLEWLSRNQIYLFPTKEHFHKWSSGIQWDAQHRFIHENSVELLVLGRRLKDGNNVGKQGFLASHGATIYSPIYKWDHEELFAYLYYENILMPPCYGWPDGMLHGTMPWPKFRKNTEKETWERLAGIDLNIVKAASGYFPLAADTYNNFNYLTAV